MQKESAWPCSPRFVCIWYWAGVWDADAWSKHDQRCSRSADQCELSQVAQRIWKTKTNQIRAATQTKQANDQTRKSRSRTNSSPIRTPHSAAQQELDTWVRLEAKDEPRVKNWKQPPLAPPPFVQERNADNTYVRYRDGSVTMRNRASSSKADSQGKLVAVRVTQDGRIADDCDAACMAKKASDMLPQGASGVDLDLAQLGFSCPTSVAAVRDLWEVRQSTRSRDHLNRFVWQHGSKSLLISRHNMWLPVGAVRLGDQPFRPGGGHQFFVYELYCVSHAGSACYRQGPGSVHRWRYLSSR